MIEPAYPSCTTCGDEAIEMRIVAIDSERSLALCQAGTGLRRTVEITLIDGPVVGEQILVHADVAIARAQGTVGTP